MDSGLKSLGAMAAAATLLIALIGIAYSCGESQERQSSRPVEIQSAPNTSSSSESAQEQQADTVKVIERPAWVPDESNPQKPDSNAQPYMNFGMPLETRRELYDGLIHLNRRVEILADTRFPDWQSMENIRYGDSLREAFRDSIILHYGINLAILDSIRYEAYLFNWPLPEPLPEYEEHYKRKNALYWEQE